MLRGFAICALLSFTFSVNALKLTLKQDLSQLQEQLSPEEIGQFLHSIKDLPKLSEYLDPIRSPAPFDLLFYYNHYGCRESRVFNMDRIRFIMTYANLSRNDRLILLNGNCIINWPDLLEIPMYDLSFLLEMFPESNPLLQIETFETFEETSNVFDWKQLKKKHPQRLTLFLDKAAKYREEFHFVPFIDNLFHKKILNSSDFPASFDRIKLISPIAVGKCFEAKPRSKRKWKACKKMILVSRHNYNDFSSRDSFYWSLNILTVFIYHRDDATVEEIQSHLNLLLKSCKWYQVELISFLKNVSKLLSGLVFKSDEIDRNLITRMFEEMCKLKWSDEDDGIIEESHEQLPTSSWSDSSDSILMAVEFFNWIERNSQIFKVSKTKLKKWLKLIHSGLAKRRNRKYRDYFVEFLEEADIWTFKKFIQNNYESEKPSNGLLRVFKKLSWIKCKNKVDFLKSFLSPDIRIKQLRRVSFNHPHLVQKQNEIEIYFHENSIFTKKTFNRIFNSLLDNDLLVYPLKIDLSASPFVSESFKQNINLETILKKFWTFLGAHDNGFVNYHSDLPGYPSQFLPLPWIHPNVSLVMGCVMTLALLHGIKLTDWSPKREFFDSIFEDLTLKPIELVDDDEESDIDSNFCYFNEGHFLSFNGMVQYSLSISRLLKDDVVFIPLPVLSRQYKKLSAITKKWLKNYQNYLFSNEKTNDLFNAHSDEVKISKLFRLIEDKTSISLGNLALNLKDKIDLQIMMLSLSDFEEISIFDVYSFLDQLVCDEDDEDEANLSAYVDILFKFQSSSFFLGIQPLTRYLTSEEAYNMIFLQ